MATMKRRKKVRKKKEAPVKKKKSVKKKAAPKKRKKAPARKEGFPTAREMRDARNEFAEEVGPKILTMSKAKELPKAMGLRASADFVDALADQLYILVFKAAKRCVSNDRKTIRPDDL